MVVRSAVPGDADAWSTMRSLLWPDESAQALAAETKPFFNGTSSSLAAVFIAQDDAKPVGFLELNLRAYSEGCESSPVPHVEGWFVDASSRGRGIGKA